MSLGWSTLSWQPVLPVAASLPLQIALSWGVLLAALCELAARTWRIPALRAVAVLLFVCAALPWTRGWTAYLALAFQTPSNVTLWVCVAAAWGWRDGPARASPPASAGVPLLPLAGVLLGWALWIDTFNRWPSGWWGASPDASSLTLYAWGFGAPVLWALALALFAHAAWTWWRTPQGPRQVTPAQQVVALALLWFALTRWPTGNVWDALLDPWLWLACHGCLLRSRYSCQKSTSSGV